MKLTTALLAVGLMAGELWAQSPNVIQNVQNTMNGVQQQKTNDSNAALGIKGAPAASPATKPAAGAPAKAPSPASGPAKSANANSASASAPAKAQAAPAAGKAAAAKPTVAVKGAAPKQVAASANIAAKTAAKPNGKISAKAPEKKNAKTVISAAPKALAPAAPVEAVKTTEAPKPPKPEEKKWAMSGKRDPFFSPVVQQPTGSGCSTGKKCLEIGSINLHGVVKSDSGFIAVVTNNLGKAYFLRENDPVFNGYVVRITGDSVVFQETYQDQLGKSLTREVVKRIFTPAV
jgi:Tfp pilus assembly protein PilP